MRPSARLSGPAPSVLLTLRSPRTPGTQPAPVATPHRPRAHHRHDARHRPPRAHQVRQASHSDHNRQQNMRTSAQRVTSGTGRSLRTDRLLDRYRSPGPRPTPPRHATPEHFTPPPPRVRRAPLLRNKQQNTAPYDSARGAYHVVSPYPHAGLPGGYRGVKVVVCIRTRRRTWRLGSAPRGGRAYFIAFIYRLSVVQRVSASACRLFRDHFSLRSDL